MFNYLDPVWRPPAEPRILGIDIENQPLWYGGGDFVYDIVNCISWKWVGEPVVKTQWLDWRSSDAELLMSLTLLREAIESADAVMGHNFGHDWKGLGATFVHLKQPLLEEKPIVDTMRCIPSGPPRSLAFLSKLHELTEKPDIDPHTWIQAVLRNDKGAIQKVMARNRADVLITEELYWKEKELGWL